MNKELMELIAKSIADSLKESVPEAVEAAVEAKMKEINLSENADFKEIKDEIKSLVEKAKFMKSKDEDLEELQGKFVEALKGIKAGDATKLKSMSEGVDEDGGYLVHPEFEKGVLRILGTYGVWKDCKVTRMASNIKIFTLRNKGVQVFYTDEAASIKDTDIKYERKELIANKITAILSSTYELIEDQADPDEIWKMAQEEFAKAIDLFLDKEVLTGTKTGSGEDASKMLGVCNLEGANIITTSGNAGTLTSDNLIDATRKISLKYKKGYNPCWYMSQDAIAIIEKLKDNDGRPLYRTLDNGEKGFLLGYPVKLSDAMPSGSLGKDVPFIAFGSLQFFGLGIRKGLTFEMGYKSGDREKDIQSLKGRARACGVALVEEAFSVIKTAA